MKTTDLIAMSMEENREYIARAIKELSPDELAWRPKPHSNSIAFLMWHLARVEDFWINQALLGEKQLYEADGWYKKFKTPAADNGGGYDVAKLAAWPVPSLKLLQEYAGVIREKTLAYLKSMKAGELDTPRDFRWRKGTTGSALSHLVSEIGEHSGQIGYLRGVMKGIEPMPPPPPKK